MRHAKEGRREKYDEANNSFSQLFWAGIKMYLCFTWLPEQTAILLAPHVKHTLPRDLCNGDVAYSIVYFCVLFNWAPGLGERTAYLGDQPLNVASGTRNQQIAIPGEPFETVGHCGSGSDSDPLESCPVGQCGLADTHLYYSLYNIHIRMDSLTVTEI
jgi:hypothetical protein